jgi:hypothetical protein
LRQWNFIDLTRQSGKSNGKRVMSEIVLKINFISILINFSKQLLEPDEVDVVHPLDKERGITQEEFRLIKIHMSFRQYFYPLFVPLCQPLVLHLFFVPVCSVVPYKHQQWKANRFNFDSVSFKTMFLKSASS